MNGQHLTGLVPAIAGPMAAGIPGQVGAASTGMDGSFDWGTYTSGLGGALAGGAAGYYGMDAFLKRMARAKGKLSAKDVAKFKELTEPGGMGPISAAKKMGVKFPTAGGATKAAEGLSGKIAAGKGKSLGWLAENPAIAKWGGAALGGLVLSKILSNASAKPRQALEAQQQQTLAQADAQNQMLTLQGLANRGGRW